MHGKITRINELARKHREGTITPDEHEERMRLRTEYIADFRGNVDKTLDGVFVEQEKGNPIPIKEHMKKMKK